MQYVVPFLPPLLSPINKTLKTGFFLSQGCEDDVSTMCLGGLRDILVSCSAIRDTPCRMFDVVKF